MRPLLHGDVAMAARVLLALPERMRPPRIRRLLRRADAADRYRQRTGLAHPAWGSGSLMAAAERMPRAPEPDFDDVDYCRCWILVLSEAMAHQGSCTGPQAWDRSEAGKAFPPGAFALSNDDGDRQEDPP